MLNKNQLLIAKQTLLLSETKLTVQERRELPSSDFGLPDTRDYPIHDAAHLKFAITQFNHCPDKRKPILAENIKRKAKELNVPIGPDSLKI